MNISQKASIDLSLYSSDNQITLSEVLICYLHVDTFGPVSTYNLQTVNIFLFVIFLSVYLNI